MAVAADGSVAAVHDGAKIVVTEVPSCAAFAELALDADAAASELAWVGTPPRLLVLSRYAAHTIVHLVDPFGPRQIAELRLEAPMHLASAVGNHALALGGSSAAILTANERGLTPYQFPARAIPATAGAAAANFVVALAGAIEEWDPQNRLPKRRLKLPRTAPITAVGGSDRVVWLTTTDDPARIDVLTLVNRGQPKLHELPEPIAQIASHPRSDLIACLGATSGRVWVIDLDGRIGLRMIGPEGIDRVEALGLVVGRATGLLAAQAKRPLTVVALERQEDVEPAPPVQPRTSESGRHPQAASAAAALDAPHGRDEPNTTVSLASPATTTAPARPATMPPPAKPAMVPPPTKPAASPASPISPVPAVSPWARAAAKAGAPDSGAQFAAFRERVAHPRASTAEALPPLWTDAPPHWRDDIARWTHDATIDAQLAAAPSLVPIDLLVARYELSPSLAPALALLYGAHLLGESGVAPIDLARVAGWPEALGRGELAEKRAAVYGDARSRIRLATPAQRVLDELPPETGRLVGTPGMVALLGPCVIVAQGPLSIVAQACITSIGGAILAAHEPGNALEEGPEMRASPDPVKVVAEARAYGAAPMMRVAPVLLWRIPVDVPIILVCDDDRTADELGLPRLT